MQTARERFFPSTPRRGSGSASTFNSNLDNPLHGSNSSSSLRGQDSAVLSALDKLQMNRPPTQMGFAALMRKPGANALNLGTAGSIMRPGTAEPRISEERGMSASVQNGNIPVIAPTPKKYHQISPPFALRDGPFRSGSLEVSRDNHSSKSPDNLVEERREESFKMPFPKKSNSHQRVPDQPEPSQYQPKLLQRRVEQSPMANDCGDQDELNVASLQRNKKRMREFDESEDSGFIERNAKRFKTHEHEENDKMSRHESRSPHPERPSSTASSAIGSYHDRPNGVNNTPPAQHLQVRVERQENLDLNSTIQLNRPQVGPSRRRSEPVGFDKLLGPGSNDLLDRYADKYEALLKKWSECSVEEWKAGAEEISARFTMMLDFAKDHLEKKLKTYSSLNAVLDSHCEILRERSETMNLARKKVVKESGNVLG